MNSSDPMPSPPGAPMPPPPNASIHDGDRAGTFPQGMGANTIPTPPNAAGDRRGGTMPLGGSASPVVPNNANHIMPGHSGGPG